MVEFQRSTSEVYSVQSKQLVTEIAQNPREYRTGIVDLYGRELRTPGSLLQMMAGRLFMFSIVSTFLVKSSSAFQACRPRTDVSQVAPLFLSNNKRTPSASEQERRDEEERRRRRKDDVVIGKTSAKKGEKDFALDPQTTEQEYLRQASAVEQEVFRLTGAGMEFLNSVGVSVQKHAMIDPTIGS